MTAVAVPVTMVALWLLRFPRILVTTTLGFLAVGALILTVAAVREVPATLHDPLAPLWSWVLLGGLGGGLTHWAAQRDRSWWVRIGFVVLVAAVVWGGTAWADRAREAVELERFRDVGVEEVVIPQLWRT